MCIIPDPDPKGGQYIEQYVANCLLRSTLPTPSCVLFTSGVVIVHAWSTVNSTPNSHSLLCTLEPKSWCESFATLYIFKTYIVIYTVCIYNYRFYELKILILFVGCSSLQRRKAFLVFYISQLCNPVNRQVFFFDMDPILCVNRLSTLLSSLVEPRPLCNFLPSSYRQVFLCIRLRALLHNLIIHSHQSFVPSLLSPFSCQHQVRLAPRDVCYLQCVDVCLLFLHVPSLKHTCSRILPIAARLCLRAGCARKALHWWH